MRQLVNLVLIASLGLSGCAVEEANRLNDEKFPLEPHLLYPVHLPDHVPDVQIAAGAVQGAARALPQPIGFSHYLHAKELEINCQMCHSEARKSIHAGVPPVQTCMNCHQYVKTDSHEVQKIHMHYCGKPKCDVTKDEFGQPVAKENSRPIPWKKVHDLPDYVHFSHKRHVGANVQCTECHGQVQLQGQFELVSVPKSSLEWDLEDWANGGDGVKDAHGDDHGEHHDDGHGGGEEMVEVRKVQTVMVREASLQMGWCLDCHASHKSINENYGESADLRRAELKDCWTCHK